MHQVDVFVALLAAVVLLAFVARRFAIAPPVALVLGGLLIGVLPFAPDVRLDPEVILLVFLPPILYPAAFEYATEDVRANLRPVAFLALGLALATIAAIAVVLHLVTGIPLAACFVLGAVLGPTDPVAATTAIRGAGAPERVAAILEGESLVNDATALTALRIAIATVGSGTFALGDAVLDFLVTGVGGALIGAAVAWVTWQFRRRLDDLELEATIAVLVAYGSFLLAEAVGVSGILATVLAGWVLGRRSSDIASPETRAGGESFWVVARFLSESILFLLVGIAFGQVLDADAARGPVELAGLVALVCAVTLGTRLAWMFTVPYVAGLLDPDTRAPRSFLDGRERTVIGLAGLRGAVSVAAALTIPMTAGGAPFPERDTLIIVGLASIVVLLVLPALALPIVIRALGLAGSDDAETREREARVALIHAALARSEELAAQERVPDEVLARIRERYEWRLRRAGALTDEQARDQSTLPETYRRVRHVLIDTERERLAELRERGELSGQGLRAIERDLDLEERRIG